MPITLREAEPRGFGGCPKILPSILFFFPVRLVKAERFFLFNISISLALYPR
jgi:hypothetical protein